jgi:prolipoprotein diacylglyceryltransferase
MLALLALLFYPKCPPQVYSSAILLFEHMAVVHLLVLQKLKEGDVCGTAKVGYGVTRHTAACWQLQICKLSCWWVSAADKLTTHNSSSIHSIALILSPFILLFFKFSICFWCDHPSLRTA